MQKARFWCLFLFLFLIESAFAVNPQVTLQISGGVTGNIVIEVYADKAPVTASNFINYVRDGFYNGLIFHRVISGFMVQGGGFDINLVQKTTGSAIINESSNGLSNIRGTLAMARTYIPDSATSQFFINHQDNLFLDYGAIAYDGNNEPYRKIGYCVFGRVISGMNVVDNIAAVATTTKNGMTDVPVNNIIIQTATVTLNAPVCPEKLIGDIDGDCVIDFADFVKMAENWLLCNSITVCS